MSNKFSEDDLEEVTLTWFEDLGFEVLYGPESKSSPYPVLKS